MVGEIEGAADGLTDGEVGFADGVFVGEAEGKTEGVVVGARDDGFEVG